MDASLNQYGIPLSQARDEDLGWDVKFVTDHTAVAVKKAVKEAYGDKGLPDGAAPVVTLNPKTWERVSRQRLAAQLTHDETGQTE